MNGLPYYKAYPRDFIEGTIGMSFELKAAYRLVLDMIYMQAGRLPDDDRYISGLLGCSVRSWKKHKETLVSMGKIYAKEGIISNFRADKELETSRKLQEKNSENALKSNKNNSLANANAVLTRGVDTDTDTDKKIQKKETNNDHAEKKILEALDIYQQVAEDVGWPKAAKLTSPRHSKLAARLKDAGGIDGWKAAMAAAKKSDFLAGRNKQGWKPNLDFFLQESSFTKLLEGAYGTAPVFEQASAQPSSAPDWPRRAKIWRESMGWSEMWGAKPNQPDFQCPSEFQRLFKMEQTA